jgi:hypothetical protein
VQAELDHFAGNIVACDVRLQDGATATAVSVYSPAWPVAPARLLDVDTSGVQLELSRNVWMADLVWSWLESSAEPRTTPWVVGGDFNLSETFDS